MHAQLPYASSYFLAHDNHLCKLRVGSDVQTAYFLQQAVQANLFICRILASPFAV